MIGSSWYNFNSLYPAPEFLGTLYLTAFLATLREQGYSIFVVKGTLPSQHPDAGSRDSPGRWFTPQEVKHRCQTTNILGSIAFHNNHLQRVIGGMFGWPMQAKDAMQGAVKARKSGYLKAILNNCIDKASEVWHFNLTPLFGKLWVAQAFCTFGCL